jgi:oligogalacturonide lyase
MHLTSKATRLVLAAALCSISGVAAPGFDLEVLPPEHQTMTDPETGAELTFLTTHPARDVNLYFHERSWLSDGSLILFTSNRERGGTMGYLTATGELVRLSAPAGGLGNVTAALKQPAVYGVRGREVVEWKLLIRTSTDARRTRSQVSAAERVLGTLPETPTTALNENADGARLAVGTPHAILGIDVVSGTVEELYRVPDPDGYGGHVQWSHTNPQLLSYAGRQHRLMVVDARERRAWPAYREWPGELVTHEHWWVDDQLVFCGGLHPKPTEDAHVKAVNVHTGVVRVLGAGSWWPGATPAEIARRNFWHCAGSDDGRWVVADNWHGDLTLFEGKTTRPRVLTAGHRTYGQGDHPHVGWDRKGRQVVFTSHRLGSPDVCVATIPAAWQEANVTGAPPGR